MNPIVELAEEQIAAKQAEIGVLNGQLEVLERIRDDARSLDGVSEEPSEAPTTGKRARRQVEGPVTRAPKPREYQQKASRGRVLEFARERGQVTVPDVERHFVLSKSSAKKHLHALLASGELEAAGKRGKAILYAPKGAVPDPDSKALQPAPLEGRVLACLSVPRTLAELATLLDMKLNLSGLFDVVLKLREQGEVERRDDGRYRKVR